MSNYDIIIIGGGPGGYVCAIRAAQLGLKTACIEGRETLGGTCLNVGCIPSKALLHASELYYETKKNFKTMGIEVDSPVINWEKMLSYKNRMIKQNTQGIEYLFNKNKVDHIRGWGEIDGVGSVKVDGKKYTSKNIVIATGSIPTSLPGIEIDQKTVVDSTGALELPEIPESMVVIGAGIIGLEMGSIFSRLGSKVTVIEYLNRITTEMDAEVSSELQKLLKRQKLKFILDSAVKKVEKTSSSASVTYIQNANNSEHTIETSVVLVATGRQAFTDRLGLDSVGIKVNKTGKIEVAKNFQTSCKNIYAIGDVTTGPMLAHKAEDEGIAIAEIISGQKGHVNYNIIPSVIYTAPEVSSVGKTEEQLKEEGIVYKVGKFPFMGNGRAKVNFSADGFVKILSSMDTNRILGAHIIGPGAGDLIHEICVAMEFGANAEDLARTCHAHPTVSEAVREAALACCDGAIHF